MPYSATLNVESTYRCACGFHGSAMVRAQSPITASTPEEAQRSARQAGLDTIAMARCPTCGARDEALRARVRGGAIKKGAVLAAITFPVTLGLFVLRTRDHSIELGAAFGAAFAVFAFGLAYWSAWMRLASAADAVEIDPPFVPPR